MNNKSFFIPESERISVSIQVELLLYGKGMVEDYPDNDMTAEMYAVEMLASQGKLNPYNIAALGLTEKDYIDVFRRYGLTQGIELSDSDILAIRQTYALDLIIALAEHSLQIGDEVDALMGLDYKEDDERQKIAEGIQALKSLRGEEAPDFWDGVERNENDLEDR